MADIQIPIFGPWTFYAEILLRFEVLHDPSPALLFSSRPGQAFGPPSRRCRGTREAPGDGWRVPPLCGADGSPRQALRAGIGLNRPALLPGTSRLNKPGNSSYAIEQQNRRGLSQRLDFGK